MNHTCYVIHSEKIVFRNDSSLHNHIINVIAKDCHSEKVLNKKMGEFLKKEVEVTGYSNILKLLYNGNYRVID